jgi:predicted flap endonuclease-1-like 5' DNA nuclease
MTQQRLAELKAMLDEMRMERDAWRDQALRLALPAPVPAD